MDSFWMKGHGKHSSRLALRQGGSYLRVVAICLAAMAAAHLFRPVIPAIPRELFLPLHMVLETASIVVGFAVFTIGWFGYKQTRNIRELILAVTFMFAAAIDLVHTLSYQGMPDFLGPNTVGKAAAYWLTARLAIGAGLLAACFADPHTRSKRLSPRYLVAFAVAMFLAVVTLVTAYTPAVGEILYDTSTGSLTVTKIALEHLSIALYLAAFLLISSRRGWESGTAALLRRSMVVAVFAGLAFTLYSSPYGLMNLVGHLFKAATYYLILIALFVSSLQRPYEQLSMAKDELHELYVDAQEHRREIEQSFARIGSALSSSLKLEAALDQIAELAADMLHADCSIVASLDKSGRVARIAAQRGGCHESYRPVDLTIRVGEDAVKRRESVLVNDLRSTGLVQCTFDHPDCLRSMICTPMVFEGYPLGVITIYSHVTAAFNEGDAKLLEGFASHAAVAMHNAISYERESRIADVLQRSLLSPSTILTDRFEIAQVYEPAMNEALVGGDFYDVVELPDGKVGLAIGDVSGKGLQAAVHTAMVKYTLRAYISEGHSPSEAMRLLNDTLCHSMDSYTFITMFFGILDTRTGAMIYANAGHEPPIYAADGRAIELPATGAALGMVGGAEYEEGRIELQEGSLLLLYTDGISEARHGNAFLGSERISEELLTCDELGSGDVAKCIHQAAIEFAGGELRDDAAILAVRALR